MKTYDDETEEAFVFYGHIALEQECVIDTDIGFRYDDGRPVFKTMNKDIVSTLQKENEKYREVLADNNIDAQEVMQFFEMCLIAGKVLGEKYEPPHLTVSKISNLRQESEKRREERRAHHLFTCLQQCVVASNPASIFVSDDSKGFAIDSTNCHPLIRMYVESMSRYGETDAVYTGAEEMHPEEVTDYLNDRVAKIDKKAGVEEIDPDSDENDDDPFRGYA